MKENSTKTIINCRCWWDIDSIEGRRPWVGGKCWDTTALTANTEICDTSKMSGDQYRHLQVTLPQHYVVHQQRSAVCKTYKLHRASFQPLHPARPCKVIFNRILIKESQLNGFIAQKTRWHLWSSSSGEVLTTVLRPLDSLTCEVQPFSQQRGELEQRANLQLAVTRQAPYCWVPTLWAECSHFTTESELLTVKSSFYTLNWLLFSGFLQESHYKKLWDKHFEEEEETAVILRA